jgi:hypothetical protein
VFRFALFVPEAHRQARSRGRARWLGPGAFVASWGNGGALGGHLDDRRAGWTNILLEVDQVDQVELPPS